MREKFRVSGCELLAYTSEHEARNSKLAFKSSLDVR